MKYWRIERCIPLGICDMFKSIKALKTSDVLTEKNKELFKRIKTLKTRKVLGYVIFAPVKLSRLLRGVYGF